MPNLQFEQDQLVAADDHIERALRSIAEIEGRLAQERRRGDDTALTEEILAAMNESLDQFRVHRELIVRTIDDIQAGRLPST